MKLYIGADHAGYGMKEYLKKQLMKKFEVVDVSPTRKEGDDYPDHAKKVAAGVKKSKDNKGILVCGTGVGVTMAANRYKGVRAALVLDEYTAKKSRISNDANVACFRGWNFGREKAVKLVNVFLKTPFDKQKRRIRRIRKLG